MLSLFRELYDHMKWADAVVWRAALGNPAVESDAFMRERFWHVHMVQRAFLSVWRGTALDRRDAASFASLADIARWGAEGHDEIQKQVAAVDDAALDRITILPWAARLTARFGREPVPTTLRDTMLQVPMHSTYHRGQLNARLRELGGEPPLTDYIAWVWTGKPAADWPG